MPEKLAETCLPERIQTSENMPRQAWRDSGWWVVGGGWRGQWLAWQLAPSLPVCPSLLSLLFSLSGMSIKISLSENVWYRHAINRDGREKCLSLLLCISL